MKHKGFTLIELLVSMGIIAVLTGMAVFNFNQSRMRARDVQRKSDVSQLQKAMELYKNDNRTYPADTNFQTTLIDGGYTKVTFNDPKGAEWYTYRYLPALDLRTYYLVACLENNGDSTKATSAQCSDAELDGCMCGDSSTGVSYILSNP